jgi:hypothetical protein
MKNNLTDYYWAGFIAADGYITKSKRISVCLSVKDLKHLKKLKIQFHVKNKIYISKTTTNTSLTFTDKILAEFLEKLNIVNKKSLTLKYPKGLKKSQELAYIIGYIDGDGTIGYNGRYLRLRILGTPNVLFWMSKILGIKHKPIIHCKSKIHIVSLYDNKKLEQLYQFSKRYNLPILNRKWNKLQEIP